MTVVELTAANLAQWSAALSAFERQFQYPLGQDQRFLIDHSPDYTAFYRAMGEARTWIAVADRRVVATMSSVVRIATVKGEARAVVYLGDLKLDPAYRGRMVLFRLFERVKAAQPSSVTAAYGVVMGGTRATPDSYSGVLGIPAFAPVADICLLRIDTSDGDASGVAPLSWSEGCALYQSGPTRIAPADAGLRSLMTPQWLRAGDALGLVEDTRRAKRLWLGSGEELLSAHLSCLVWSDARSVSALVRGALRYVHDRGMPALFVTLTPEQLQQLAPAISDLTFTTAPAHIYATDAWCRHLPINSADI